MTNENTDREIETVNAAVAEIDARIAALRAEKKILAGKRAALVAEREFQAKVANLTAEQKRRIVVKAATGTSKAE